MPAEMAVEGRAVKQLLVTWVLYQHSHREEGGQHSTAQHTQPCHPPASTLCPGQLLTLQLTEPGSFPVGKCLAGTKDNPESFVQGSQ